MTAHDFIETGRAERCAGNLESAASSYRSAVEVLRNANDTLGLAHAIRHVGDILQDAGELKAAEPYYEEALFLYRPNPDTNPLDLANAARGYALLLERLNHDQQAILLWVEAREHYAGCNVQPGIDEANFRLEVLRSRIVI